MNKIIKIRAKLYTALAVFLIGAGLVSSPSFAEGVPGSICTSPNLQQALKGMANNQGGIQNTNATESFFTACPIPIGNTRFYAGIDIAPTFPASGGDMQCILRFGKFDNSAFASITVDIDTTMNTNGTPERSFPVDGMERKFFTPVDSFMFPNVSVVCPLGPGEGIGWIWVYENA